MTNKERYKQAFSVLHTSDQFSVEVENMSRLNKKHNMKVAAAALAGCILLAGGTGSAYAANVGGIQRTVQVWLHGDQTTANMTVCLMSLSCINNPCASLPALIICFQRPFTNNTNNSR